MLLLLLLLLLWMVWEEAEAEAEAEEQTVAGSAVNDQGIVPTAPDHASDTAAAQDPHGTTGR